MLVQEQKLSSIENINLHVTGIAMMSNGSTGPKVAASSESPIRRNPTGGLLLQSAMNTVVNLPRSTLKKTPCTSGTSSALMSTQPGGSARTTRKPRATGDGTTDRSYSRKEPTWASPRASPTTMNRTKTASPSNRTCTTTDSPGMTSPAPPQWVPLSAKVSPSQTLGIMKSMMKRLVSIGYAWLRLRENLFIASTLLILPLKSTVTKATGAGLMANRTGAGKRTDL